MINIYQELEKCSNFSHKNRKQLLTIFSNFTTDKKIECLSRQHSIFKELRDNYVKKMSKIIKPNGKIAGLLFQFPLTEKGPPFGGSKQEYIKRFSPYFELKTLETAYNSIKPRVKNELFIIFEKK